MSRPSLPALICLPLVATMVAACGTQFGGGSSADKRYEDLRGLVLEQRKAIEDLRREQESVRAAIDQLQYGRRGAAGRPMYGPGGPTASEDSYWQRPTPPVPDGSTYPTGPGVRGLGEPGAGAGAAPVVASVPPAPSPAIEPVKSSVPPELVGTSYDNGLRQMGSGDYDESIQSFRNYLHENGASAYADDAQFWIGESYFRKGQYHRAIIEFNQVSINYGSGDKAPAALLRQAEAFRIVGDKVDARLSLQKITNRYPGTGEAAKASKMLAELGG
jgi:tol-pal system protein YbgF